MVTPGSYQQLDKEICRVKGLLWASAKTSLAPKLEILEETEAIFLGFCAAWMQFPASLLFSKEVYKNASNKMIAQDMNGRKWGEASWSEEWGLSPQ